MGLFMADGCVSVHLENNCSVFTQLGFDSLYSMCIGFYCCFSSSSLLWWQLSIELEQELGNAKIVLSVSALENLSDNGMGMVHTILPQEHEE